MIQAKRAYVKEAGHARNWPKYLLLGLGIYLVWTLFKGVLEIRQAYLRIEEAKATLEQEKAKKEELASRLSEVKTAEYIEKVARNDLNMQLPGETIVVLPEIGKTEGADESVEEKEVSNWEKWWNLIK